MYGYETFHDELMQNLINSVHTDKSSHAYIFEGDKGLNIRNAARLFAAALCCRDSAISPCGSCPSCIEAKADTNPDIVYVTPLPDRKTIGAKVMRSVEDDAAIKPFAATRKVYIIDNAEIMTEPAQNVFLKTLEEPPEYAVFILIIENADILLQTIRSRALIVHFPSVSDDAVSKYIQNKYGLDGERLEFLVKYCAGIPLTADKILADEEFDLLREESLKMLPLLFSNNITAAFSLQQFADKYKNSFALAVDFWLSFLRDALIISHSDSAHITNIDKRESIRKICSKINPENIIQMCDRLIQAEKMLARYVSAKAVIYWVALK